MIASGMYLLCCFEISIDLKLMIQLKIQLISSPALLDGVKEFLMPRRFGRKCRFRGFNEP